MKKIGLRSVGSTVVFWAGFKVSFILPLEESVYFIYAVFSNMFPELSVVDNIKSTCKVER